MHRQIQLVTALIVGSALLASAALAQQYVYPAKGQSADQQKKDEYECHQWAVKQTGFDPTKAPPPAAAAPPPEPVHREDRVLAVQRAERSSAR